MITRLPIQRPTRLVRLTPRCRTVPQRRRIVRKRILFQNASSSGEENPGNSQEEGSWNWNPFAEDKSKQEAAEKALREAFGDQKDVLAQFERGGDDDGGGDDGGGGGWNWSWDDFRNGFFGILGMFGRWLQGVGKSISAILVFALGLLIMGILPPAASALMTFLKVLFRIEKAEDVYGKRKVKPAGRQRSVLFSDDEEEETPVSK